MSVRCVRVCGRAVVRVYDTVRQLLAQEITIAMTIHGVLHLSLATRYINTHNINMTKSQYNTTQQIQRIKLYNYIRTIVCNDH